jgi:hypothetical protein
MAMVAVWIDADPLARTRHYACPLAGYRDDPCPTGLTRGYTIPRCPTHHLFMKEVSEARFRELLDSRPAVAGVAVQLAGRAAQVLASLLTHGAPAGGGALSCAVCGVDPWDPAAKPNRACPACGRG